MNSSSKPREEHPRSSTRAGLEDLLTPLLPRQCAARLWNETWEWAEVSPTTLLAWARRFGTDVAALAVAAGTGELELRRHLADDRVPDRDSLEMLADLNCFPYSTPAARPVALHAVGVSA